MDDPLELEIRRKIYNFILKNPGIHFSKIAEILKIRTSLVDYHILFLEKHNLIDSDKETGYKRLYAKGKIGAKDKKYLFILRQKTLLNIVIQLLKGGNLKHKDLERVKKEQASKNRQACQQSRYQPEFPLLGLGLLP